MADSNTYYRPPTQASEGGKLDNTYPDGVGQPSPDQPVLKSPQPVPTPGDVTPRRSK